MANFKFVAGFLALVIVSNNAFAGFQSMRPPSGWSKSANGQGQFKPAPTDVYDLEKRAWLTQGSMNIGGRELSVPVRVPLASVGTVALAIATTFTSNPAILLATAAWTLYNMWMSDNKMSYFNGPQGPEFKQQTDTESFYYQVNDTRGSTALGACNAYLSTIGASNGYLEYNGPQAYCYYDTWKQQGGFGVNKLPFNQTTTRTLTAPEAASQLALRPPSQDLVTSYKEPLPVVTPAFNPSPTGTPQVLRVPQGSPIAVPLPSPNPDNLPQTWKTPVIDVVPAPTPSDPWRVEVIPRDIIKTNPTPIYDPLNPTPTDPVAPPVAPPTDPDTKTQDKPQTLCEQYPDILACAKPNFDTPATPQLETKPKDVTYAPQSGWSGGGGACPAPRHLPGANIDFEFTLVCQFMSGIKPVMLAIASLAAGMIIIGARGGAAE